MIYLSHFQFPTREEEYDFTMSQKRTCYDTVYPFLTISKHNLRMLDFEPVTILYGGNGSGKTTVLNVIAEKLGLEHDTLYNRSNFFEDYTRMCSYELECNISRHSRIITSDDVFDFMLNLRSINNGINQRREGAKIYDMDEEIVDVKKWTELANVRAYFDFFMKHEKEFR